MTLIHIENQLYQADKVESFPNCNRQISEAGEGEITLLDQKAEVKKSCNYCGHDVIIFCSRVKPQWVHLGINGKEMKTESIQTCSERWVVSNF